MSSTGRQVDRTGRNPSSSASLFNKVLQAFEDRDLPYSDVVFHLRRLLAAGASPQELLEVLRRYESIEAFPEYALAELLRILNEAIERAPVPTPTSAPISDTAAATRPAAARTATDENPSPAEERIARHKADDYKALTHAYERARDAASSAVARTTALASELAAARSALDSEQSKTRELESALAESIASNEAAIARSDEAARAWERDRLELRAARDSLAALGEELANARSALEAAQHRPRETDSAVAESAARDAALLEAQHSLAQRDAELAAVQRERTELATALESRVAACARLETDLQASHARSAALGTELANTRTALESQQDKVQQMDRALAEKIAAEDAARKHGEAALRKLDRYQGELRTLRASLATQQNEHRSIVAALEARAKAVEAELQADRTRIDARSAESIPGYETTVAIEPVRPAGAPPLATDWRMEPTLWESDAAADPPFDAQQPGAHAGKARHAVKTRRTAGAIARTIGVGAAIIILAIAAWSVVRKLPEAPLPAVVMSSAPVPGSVIRDCPTCPPMTVVPAGRFKQGSARAEGVSASFERPLHWVAIRRPIALSTNAVTVDEFGAFVAATGRDMRGCDTYDDKWRYRPDRSWQNPGFAQTGSHPVTCVSWDDAKAYAAWLSMTTGHVYRLPSASEWEYAARAGGEAVQPWNPDGSGACASANVADQRAARQYPGWAVFPCDDGYVYTAAVGSFKANSFGLNDMLGNVFQWTADCWHADYTGAPVDGSPRTYGDCSERELRGGSWFTTPEFVRASYRNHFAATYRASTVGIRLVRDIPS